MKTTGKKPDKNTQHTKTGHEEIRQGNEDWNEGQEKKGNQNWNNQPVEKPDLRVKNNKETKDIVKGLSSPNIKRK
jgi:hypothetical protein